MTRLRVGLIGCGHISTTHLKSWALARGCCVQGVFDVDVDQAAAQALRFAVPELLWLRSPSFFSTSLFTGSSGESAGWSS